MAADTPRHHHSPTSSLLSWLLLLVLQCGRLLRGLFCYPPGGLLGYGRHLPGKYRGRGCRYKRRRGAQGTPHTQWKQHHDSQDGLA